MKPCNCKRKTTAATSAAAADTYPGVAVDMADDEKDTAKLRKERTRTINNNPRNNSLDQ